ncbi:MAG: sensor N-terminal transmembrane domain-containing protein [Spirochaetales bacterium]|nr:sensor N-terminal transmembrane domain-containing protein [Spirochaetales bacterium]
MRFILNKISVRLLAFNLLLLSLPMISILYLDTYEGQLLRSQENSMIQQGRVMAAALSGRSLETEAGRIIRNLNQRVDSRIRVVDAGGRLLADTSQPDVAPAAAGTRYESVNESGYSARIDAQDTFLYRIAVYPINTLKKLLFPPSPDLGRGEFYSGKLVLDGDEVRMALGGRYGAATRLSSGGQISVNLYSAIPVYWSENEEEVVGAVLVSRSTYQILSYLYELRLDIIRIFLIFLILSAVLSFALALNITIPVVRLKNEAGEILDKSGNFRSHFTGFKRGDEIGELSRSLTRLSSDLENKMDFIDKFTSDILHELKNPLSTIRGAAEMALRGGVEVPSLLQNILDEERRMERLLVELREISSLENLFENEKKEEVDLADILPVILSRYPHKQYPGISNEFTNYTGEECRVRINIDRLVQAVTNPVDNALSFSPEGGTVRLGLYQDAGSFRIEIDDEGPGVARGMEELVFDRFYSDRDDEFRKDHSGLGLSIVKSIISYYGGNCWIENREAGGCRFILVLPAGRA